MSQFLDSVITAAQANRQRVVLPEGHDERTIEAARICAERGIADVIVLSDDRDLSIPGVTVVDHRTSAERDRYAQALAKLREKKGLTLEGAYALLDDELYYGVMMVKMGDADAMTSGACHPTGDVLRPALQIIKCATGEPMVSSFFEITVPNCPFGDNGTFFFADCGLNTYPDAEGLATIAIQTARSWRSLMGSEPRVAMLSYSSLGSADDEHTQLVREAVRIAHEKAPELALDGELQFDAAVVPSVAASKAPGSPVAGRANVLVFPNLDAGNIGYKIAQRLGLAEAIGPVLQGLAAPVNDLSRGCSAQDIVGMVALSALQARHIKETRV
ncbi:MAG: phosphate acetyltransferase [Coriobacteriia bacterium]|nr:phosphate acetyltransferase [Coriobacteriia bacterium]MBS5477094.1 phosphate acetyltransferase [Coriobacteriia bacterium]